MPGRYKDFSCLLGVRQVPVTYRVPPNLLFQVLLQHRNLTGGNHPPTLAGVGVGLVVLVLLFPTPLSPDELKHTIHPHPHLELILFLPSEPQSGN